MGCSNPAVNTALFLATAGSPYVFCFYTFIFKWSVLILCVELGLNRKIIQYFPLVPRSTATPTRLAAGQVHFLQLLHFDYFVPGDQWYSTGVDSFLFSRPILWTIFPLPFPISNRWPTEQPPSAPERPRRMEDNLNPLKSRGDVMIVATREWIRPLVRVVDHLPAVLVVMFFLQF